MSAPQITYHGLLLDVQMLRDSALSMLNRFGTSRFAGPFDIYMVGLHYFLDSKKRAAINKVVGVG